MSIELATMINRLLKLLKNFLFSNAPLLIILIGVFSVFVISCVDFHSGLKCHAPFSLPSQIFSKENLLVYNILLSFIAYLSIAYLSIVSFQKQQTFLIATFFPLSLALLWFWQYIFKIYNPILESFRRGIIHSQIYKFLVIFS